MPNREHYYLVCGDSFEVDRFLLLTDIFSVSFLIIKMAVAVQ